METAPAAPRSVAVVARPILAAFLATFLAARLLVYLVMSRRLPNVTVHAGGTHIHHLNFGIFLLVVVAGALLLRPGSARLRRACGYLYGIGLALTFDEFGMWLHLGGGYWQRTSFDAMVVIAATLALLAAAPALRAFRSVHWSVAVGLGLALLAFGLLAVDAIRSAEDRWWPSLQALDLDPPP